MTLRDYFAGQALSGLLAKHGLEHATLDEAETAYQYADAMLRARNRVNDMNETEIPFVPQSMQTTLDPDDLPWE